MDRQLDKAEFIRLLTTTKYTRDFSSNSTYWKTR